MVSITVFVGTGVNDNSNGGTRNWISLEQASSDNGFYLQSVFSAGTETTQYARLPIGDVSSIPSTATIDGIKVELERRELNTIDNVIDASVRLYKDGTGFVGSDKADTLTEWPTNDTIKTYGGPSDLWGTAWTRNEVVNDLEFGIAVNADQGRALIDYVKITIYYTNIVQFAGSTDLNWGGSAALAGGLHQFDDSLDTNWGGSVSVSALLDFNGSLDLNWVGTAGLSGALQKFADSLDLNWGGSADISSDYDFRWSIEYLEASTSYGFPTVYVEVSNITAPSGAFPSGDAFEKRLLELPIIEEQELDSRFGISGVQNATLRLSNADRAYNNINFQDAFVRIWFVDADGNTKEFNGKVTEWTLSHICTLTVEDIAAITINQYLPKRTLNDLVEAEKAVDGTFENVVIANDLGKPIPLIFGRAVKVPLLYVKADDSNRHYDYILGEGAGLNSKYFQEVFTAYRDEKALDSIEGTMAAASPTTLTLEAGDRRPDDWYNYWWAEMTSGNAAGSITDVTDYSSSGNRLTVSAWGTTPTSGNYRLKEWRFYDGSQAGSYAGYAFIRFKKRMGTAGRTDPVYADVNGLEDEVNVILAIQSLLTNSDWGLGLNVDTTTFNTAAALSAITAMKCEGALISTVAATDILRELLSFRDIVLHKNG